jgi:hypothetical protein
LTLRFDRAEVEKEGRAFFRGGTASRFFYSEAGKAAANASAKANDRSGLGEYADLLGLGAEFTRADVMRTFRHPDKGGDPAISRRLIEARDRLEDCRMTTESDIVERLRRCDKNFELVQEAADEIERLRKALAAERAANADIVMLKQAADEIARLRTQNEVMSADNERLRAALERLVAYLVPGIISR